MVEVELVLDRLARDGKDGIRGSEGFSIEFCGGCCSFLIGLLRVITEIGLKPKTRKLRPEVQRDNNKFNTGLLPILDDSRFRPIHPRR